MRTLIAFLAVSVAHASSVRVDVPREKDRPRYMVNVARACPGVRVSLVYATPHNLCGTALYPRSAKAWVTDNMARKLNVAIACLEKDGLGLVILDAYRPWTASVRIWNSALAQRLDRSYFAPPALGSDHNRGSAVDVTVFSLKTGKIVEMPTPFDSTDVAPPNAYSLSLARAMIAAGLVPHSKEWWHFSCPESTGLPLGDWCP